MNKDAEGRRKVERSESNWKCGIDTKAGHLLSDAVARKLFDIKEDSRTKLQVRFVTDGKQSKLRDKVIKGGFTIWKMKSGAPTPIHVPSLKKAVTVSLK